MAWCYLKIGNMSELPNAAQRLAECESKFVQSYGANLERVKALKGSSGEEAVLMVRMHLLQAIVAFHSGHLANGKSMLRSTSAELDNLRVPHEILEEVMASGFTAREARLALRSQNNNVSAAIRHAQQTKEAKEKTEKEELERKRKRRKFGKTAEGNWVNLGFLNTMVKMGYEESLAASALRHCENDVNAAIQTINEHPELLFEDENRPFDPREVTKEMIDTVLAMGFDQTSAMKALIKFKGDIGKAVDALTSGALDSPTVDDKEKERNKEEAYERMQEDLDGAESYLDLTLDDEKTYLDRYMKLMDL